MIKLLLWILFILVSITAIEVRGYDVQEIREQVESCNPVEVRYGSGFALIYLDCVEEYKMLYLSENKYSLVPWNK